MDVKRNSDDFLRTNPMAIKVQEVTVPQEFLLVSAVGLEPSTP